MVKKGDTLIEVLLAVGIFSMIAISVVAVLSSGTSGAQTALETTLAREEIDAQAEALRYIHAAYITDKDSNDSSLASVKLWRTITSNAIVLKDKSESAKQAILQYRPQTCQELYNGDESIFSTQKPFILNTKKLNDANAAAYINSRDILTDTTTYPRLIFGNNNNENDDTAGLVSNSYNDLLRAEGIYVVAVADDSGTELIDLGGEVIEDPNSIAFYDFYIRTCWYGANANEPSTISTVIRLYNPDAVTETAVFTSSINNSTPRRESYQIFTEQDKQEVMNDRSWWPNKDRQDYTKGWEFLGWCNKDDIVTTDNGTTGCGNSLQEVNTIFYSSANANYDFVPVFEHVKYTITYNSNGSSWTAGPQICYGDENNGKCTVKADDVTRSGYRFKGWCSGAVTIDDIGRGVCQGRTYQKGENIDIPDGFPGNRIINLTAIWDEQNEVITINAQWTSDTDYDSYMELSKPGGSGYQYATWGTTNIPVTYRGQTYSLITGAGDGRGNINSKYYESFVINTLGGKNYYYSLHNWSVPGFIGDDITITVSGEYLGVKTFRSTTRNNCNYWNIFAYKDGTIVERNTCSQNMEYDW